MLFGIVNRAINSYQNLLISWTPIHVKWNSIESFLFTDIHLLLKKTKFTRVAFAWQDADSYWWFMLHNYNLYMCGYVCVTICQFHFVCVGKSFSSFVYILCICDYLFVYMVKELYAYGAPFFNLAFLSLKLLNYWWAFTSLLSLFHLFAPLLLKCFLMSLPRFMLCPCFIIPFGY